MDFLIVDRMHNSLMPMLERIGVRPHYHPDITRAEIAGQIEQYDGLIVRSKIFVDEALLTRAPRLKYICRAGAGIDNLDVAAIAEKGIEIINAPEGNRNALAEHALGLLLALLNNVVKGDREVRGFKWDREGNRGYELSNLKVGIVGYGFMGSAFADKVKHLAGEVLVYDKYKSGFGDDLVREVGMEEIYEEVDVLSIHIPLTEETRFMFNSDYFSKFKKPIWLINTSRGEVMSMKTLVDLLKGDLLRGAALDVLENEKINSFTPWERDLFDYLVDCEQVILTPHVGGWSFESYQKINEVIVEKLQMLLPVDN